MRKMIRLSLVAAAAATLLLLTGCERDKVSRELNALTEMYKNKMEKGETTPQQDQDFIRAVAKNAYELDRSIRGTKRATETRQEADDLQTTQEPVAPAAPEAQPATPAPQPSEQQGEQQLRPD